MAILLNVNNYTVRTGTRQTPDVAIPSGFTWVNISLGRDNWPAAGCTIRIYFTYNGTDWVKVREEFIAQGSIDPKTGTIPDASIGFGWGGTSPLRAYGETVNPNGNFNSRVTLEIG